MTTRKHNIIVIGSCAIIAISISMIQWRNHGPQHIENRVYRVKQGWGYDILVDGDLFIRQESIPAIRAGQPFKTKEEARLAAQLVIDKLRSGQSPALTKTDLDNILPAPITQNEQPGKHQ